MSGPPDLATIGWSHPVPPLHSSIAAGECLQFMVAAHLGWDGAEGAAPGRTLFMPCTWCCGALVPQRAWGPTRVSSATCLKVAFCRLGAKSPMRKCHVAPSELFEVEPYGAQSHTYG